MAEPFHVPFVAGERVRVRGRNWRITGVTEFATCATLSMQGADGSTFGQACILIYPFDRPARLPPRTTLRVVSRRRGLRAIATHIASTHPFTGLRAASDSRADLHPFQLEPALAICGGLTSRLLLADEVGLGKTIQAGLILAELRARGDCDRALVVVPSGMRDQWARELTTQFGLAPKVIDLASLAVASSELPVGMNPWALPGTTIVSIDFIKQPEVSRALSALLWDVLILDEAHHLAASTDRGDLARRLASRSRHVLLLTATPHGGDEREFRSLCAIGATPGDDDAIVMLRRSRSDVGVVDDCRVKRLSVEPTAEERHLHAHLDRYARDLRCACAPHDATRASEIQLLIAVLYKRAFSSASSLLASVQRRHRLLQSDQDPALDIQQALPFEEENLADDVDPRILAARGLEDAGAELRTLESLASAAERAAQSESKLRILRRLLRRTTERVIVFTEYRDTLMRIARELASEPFAILHGGMTGRERLASEARFRSGDARVLIATDAAGEGLNLHHRCRLVVSLELPWSPLRLEQRIGRVHRLGQTRRVHALALLARGTKETRVLARLTAKATAARRTLTSAPELGPTPAVFRCVDLKREAEAECARLVAHRRLATASAGTPPTPAPFIVRPRRRRASGQRGVFIYHAEIHDGLKRTLEPLVMALDPDWSVRRRMPDRILRILVRQESERLGENLAREAKSAIDTRAAVIGSIYDRLLQRRRAREGSVLAVLHDARADAFACLTQRPLFYRNAREVAADRVGDTLAAAIRGATERVEALETSSDVHVCSPELLAVLTV